MALIICPECGKEYSDRVSACPNCACPTPKTAYTEHPTAELAQPVKKASHGFRAYITGVIVLAFLVLGTWYGYRVQSYNAGIRTLYAGDYSSARKSLEGLYYKDSELVLNDIYFLEDLEKIAAVQMNQDDDIDVLKYAKNNLKKLSKYQTTKFHTEGLDTMVDRYIEGLERIIGAFDFETASAAEFEMLAGAYYCDQVYVSLHDNMGFMSNNADFDSEYRNVIAKEEAMLEAFKELAEKGHTETKAGDFGYKTVTLNLRNDTDYRFGQAYIFNFYDRSGNSFLETVATDVFTVEPYEEYTVSVDIPKSASNGYSVTYSYYINDIDIPD